MTTKTLVITKRFLLALWLILIIGAVRYYINNDITTESIRNFVKLFGVWSILIYILAYTIRPLVFFPTSIMTASSVLLFGPFWAWIITYIGENLSASLAFFIARFFGRKFVREHENSFLKKYDHKLSHCGFETIIFLRFVPLFPFDFVNYSAGLSSVRYRDYLLGTLLGVIPGLTAYIFLGVSFTTNPVFIIPTILGFMLLAYIANVWRKHYGECQPTNIDNCELKD